MKSAVLSCTFEGTFRFQAGNCYAQSLSRCLRWYRCSARGRRGLGCVLSLCFVWFVWSAWWFWGCTEGLRIGLWRGRFGKLCSRLFQRCRVLLVRLRIEVFESWARCFKCTCSWVYPRQRLRRCHSRCRELWSSRCLTLISKDCKGWNESHCLLHNFEGWIDVLWPRLGSRSLLLLFLYSCLHLDNNKVMWDSRKISVLLRFQGLIVQYQWCRMLQRMFSNPVLFVVCLDWIVEVVLIIL